MKAIVLSRVSTGHQDLDQQTVKVKEYAIRDGYSEEDLILIEDVESAVKLSEEERNGLNTLKQYILTDSEINCVYTYEISRISRQAKIVYSIRDFLIKRNIQLVVLNPLFKMLKDDGTLSETSNIFFGIFSSLAENEGYIRKARIKKAVDKYRAMGLHTGGNIMFGYSTNKDNEYTLHEENAKIVRDIFEMYVFERMSIRKIAKELHERGTKMWTCDTPRKSTSYLTMCCNVNNILHRKEYYGAVKGRPAIISKELFDEAQSIMKNRIISDYKKDVHAVLKGMLKDANTKLLLSSNSASKMYYNKRKKGANISWSCADTVIIEWCNSKMKEWTDSNNMALLQELQEEYNITWEKENQIRKRKEECLTSIDTLEERIILGKTNVKVAEKLEDKLKKEIEQLIEAGMQNFLRRRTITNRMEHIQRSKPKMIDDTMTVDEKHETIKSMIDVIYISRPERLIANLEIHTRTGKVEIIKVDTFHKKII